MLYWNKNVVKGIEETINWTITDVVLKCFEFYGCSGTWVYWTITDVVLKSQWKYKNKTRWNNWTITDVVLK